MKRRARSGAIALAVLSASAAHAADPAHSEATLDYAVPAELATCPDRDAFASAVATRLGYDPFASTTRPPKTLTVRFHREGTAIVADLRLAGESSDDAKKSITSESGACAELGSATAFAAAILLDPRAMFPKPKPPAAGTAERLDSRSPGTWPWYEPPPLPPAPPSPPPAAEPMRVRVGVAATGCVGCAPAPNVGGTVFFGLEKGRFGIDLGARGDLPASTTSPSKREVSSSLVLGELFPHARFGPLRAGVLGSVGALFGDSAGDQNVSVWAGAGARLAFEWTMAPPIFVRAALDGVFALGRVSLRVDGRELWSTPPLVGGAALGAGLKF